MNKQVLLAARPVGFPKESDFRIVETAVPAPENGQLLVEIEWLSVDPYMRGRMSEAKSYAEPVKLGDVMTGGAVGRVIQSRRAEFQEGDYVAGQFGWQRYALTNGKGIRKVDPSLAPLSTALGVLGMPGLTAYFGLLEIGQPKSGETVVVSGAAGAVGSCVGQIAKLHGCRVVGVAGDDEKVRHLTEDLGFDAAFNYKTHKDYRAALEERCPNGIDVYFDNVGGTLTDAVFTLANTFARIVICGQIALYNAEKPEMGPRLLMLVLTKQLKVEGFIVSRFAERSGEALAKLGEWVRSGQIKYRENVVESIENAPRAFIEMLNGSNIGKQLVKIR
jgi:NADPH:quinone reductase